MSGPLTQAILALLAILVIGVVWVGIELRRLNATIEPIAGSSIVAGLSAL